MRRLLLLAAAFAALAFAYSLVVPPFETPDEVYHFAFARHLAAGNGLPVQSATAGGPWEQEGSQAPLYYAAAGLLMRGIAQDDFAALTVRNPRANIGDPLYPGNKNFMLYSGRHWPLAGTNLALHLGRWLSLALGIVTVLATYGLAQAVFGRDAGLPLLAAALVAAIPQFAFLSGSFTNDALVTAASAATLYWLARLLAKQASEPVRTGEWLVLGLLLAVAALSKLQGLGLFLLAALAGIGMARQRKEWRLPLRALLPVALPPLLLAAWWYARNIWLYDDWTGLRFLLEINGRRVGDFDLADWWLEFRGLRYSFWGLFGWFNILLPTWIYTVLDAVTVLALAGGVAAIVQRWRRGATPQADGGTRVLLLALLWSLMSFALLVYWTIQATGSQGRLLFPALSALALLFVAGVEFWLLRLPARAVRPARAGFWSALLALLIGSSLYALAVLLPRSYDAGPPIAALPAAAEPLAIRFGEDGAITLAGISLPDGRFRPGDDVPITLYLRADRPLAEDYELFLQLLDENGQEVANITTHPGWGRRPTSLWEPHALYADAYLLRIARPPGGRAPLLARVYTGFIDPATAHTGNLPLPATSNGRPMTPFVGTVAISPVGAPSVETLGMQPVGAVFGNVVRLAGACRTGAGSVLPYTVRLLYEALGAPATQYTAFVHALDASGARVDGFDRAPAGDRFPTDAWRSGDAIVTDFPLMTVGTTGVTLWTGLYESASAGAVRLPLTDAAGLPAGDGQVALPLPLPECRPIDW